MAKVINGMSIPNLPWEDKPAGCTDTVWRSSKNPIITRKDASEANSIFNSAVVPFGDGFRGVFRIDSYDMLPMLRTGKSKDGIKWEISDDNLEWTDRNPDIGYEYGYDPRVIKFEDGKYYVQDGVTYLCNRDSEVAVYHALKDLVGIYCILA